jgi:hypothetical protein
MNCSGSCVDLGADVRNCGACGQACEPPTGLPFGGTSKGLVCQAGQCVCPSDKVWACGAGTSGRCVSFLSNSDCGLCSATCSSGTRCDGGLCQCDAPMKMCGASCVNPQTSPYDCGSCGNPCPKAQPLCSKGSCVTSCDAGLTNCGSACVDLDSDLDNCGKCYTACAAPKKCVAGACL